MTWQDFWVAVHGIVREVASIVNKLRRDYYVSKQIAYAREINNITKQAYKLVMTVDTSIHIDDTALANLMFNMPRSQAREGLKNLMADRPDARVYLMLLTLVLTTHFDMQFTDQIEAKSTLRLTSC